MNGGTDLMVEIDFDRRRPAAPLDLSLVERLRGWDKRNGAVEPGAGVAYTDVVERLSRELPALAIAYQTVGSPRIRNRGPSPATWPLPLPPEMLILRYRLPGLRSGRQPWS